MNQKFKIIYFEIDERHCPVQEFLDSLDVKMASKIYGMMGLLEEYGNDLRMPYSRYLEDGIFELRSKQGSNITRVLYFFYIGQTIVMTNGFVKKTQETPKSEMALAKKYRDMYFKQQEEGKK